MKNSIFILVLSLFFNTDSSLAKSNKDNTTQNLYKMGRWNVVVKSGNYARGNALRKGSDHEIDPEHSLPKDDPSPRVGFQFKLKDYTFQDNLVRDFSLNKIAHASFFAWSRWFAPLRYSYRDMVKDKSNPFRFFKINQDKVNPKNLKIQDSPTTVNSNYEYYGISDRSHGYCWGYATLNRYFTQIAFFDPSRIPPKSIPKYVQNGLKKNQAWFKYYQGIIDGILSGHPRVIPGFSNYREFSLVPEIEFYLKLKSMDLWAERAIGVDSFSTFYTSTRIMEEKKIAELLKTLKTRLKRGELPKILFTAKNSEKMMGGTVDVHSVLVTGVEEKADGSAKILLWDINFYREVSLKTPNFIEVRAAPRGGHRELHYKPWFEDRPDFYPQELYESSMLGEVRLAPENDVETAIMASRLKDFCNMKGYSQRYCKGLK